jgi:NADPH-dependent 2,4-dienoyl-CoA reductase/sulfur reductase-like enzyme
MLFLSEGQSVPATAIATGRRERERFIPEVGEALKKVVSIPIGASGYMHHPVIANTTLAAGKLDFVGLGRPSLVDPDLPNKIREGREDDILQCVRCNQGCNGRVAFFKEAMCLVNPLLGREKDHAELAGPKSKQKVFIAGAGMAGMEAAIFAAERGHAVTLYEAGDKLGGQWLLAALPPEKTQLNTLTIWQKRRLNQLRVLIKLNTPLTAAIVDQEKPDAVIIATGAIPVTPKIPGASDPQVVQAFDVLSLKTQFEPGTAVAVIGGGMVGCETASHLALQGCQVTILEMLDAIAQDAIFMNRPNLLHLLEALNVQVITGARVQEIAPGRISYEKAGSSLKLEPVGRVVLAIGAKSNNGLAEALAGKAAKIITIGDANTPGKGLEAMHNAYEAAVGL